MGRRSRSTALILFATIGLEPGFQQAAHGAEAVTPPGSSAGNTANFSTVQVVPGGGALPIAEAAQTQVPAPLESQAGMTGMGSMERQPSRRQKRRKPKMAGVPGGAQVMVAADEAPQTVAQEGGKAATASATVAQPAAAPVGVKPGPTQALVQQGDDDRIDEPDAVAVKSTQPILTAGYGGAEQAEEPAGGYQLAPIKWAGTASAGISLESGMSSSPGERKKINRLADVEAVGVSARSFIMKPWIATVRGGLGLSSSAWRDSSSGGGNNAKRTNKLSGDGGFTLFPRSPFPFTLDFTFSDSKANRGMVNAASLIDNGNRVDKRLLMTQKYSPRRSVEKYVASYERLDRQFGFGRIASSTWRGNYNTKLGTGRDQPFSLRLTHQTTNLSDSVGTKGRFDTAQMDHTYLPADSLLSLRSNASFIQSIQSLGAGADTSTRNVQAYTVGSWQPESEDIPLVVKGDARISQLENTGNRLSAKSTVIAGGLSATYAAQPDLGLSAGASIAATTQSNTTSRLLTSLNGRAIYRPASVMLGEKFRYSHGMDGGFRYTAQTGAVSDPSISGAAFQGLGIPYTFSLFGKGSSISTNLNQRLGLQLSRVGGVSGTLAHGASVSWSPYAMHARIPGLEQGVESSGGGAGLFNSVSLSVQDMRTFGPIRLHTTAVRLGAGLSGNSGYSVSAYGAKANMSVAATRYTGQKGSNNANATLDYDYDYSLKKKNALNVRGLTYAMEVKLLAGLALARDQAAFNNASLVGKSNRNPYSLTVNQVLSYRIGNNEARLVGYVGNIYGRRGAVLLMQFRAWRNFGN